MLRGGGKVRLSWTFMTINFFYSPIGYFCFFRFCFPSTRPYNYTFFFFSTCVCSRLTHHHWLMDFLAFSRSPPESIFYIILRPSQLTFSSSSALIDRALDCMFHPLFLFLFFFLNSIQFSSSFSRERIWRVSKSIHPDV